MSLQGIALPKNWRDTGLIVAISLFACTAAFLLCYLTMPIRNLTAFFLYQQDRWLLLGAMMITLFSSRRIDRHEVAFRPARWLAPATALALVSLCYAGHYWLLSGYAMSRDEQMALFDASIFESGKLVAPLAAEWVRHTSALNTLFMLPVEHPSAWISAYLPMNAVLHAAVGLVADAALTGPLLVGIGAIALHGCIRILWPDRPEASLLALLLYALSGQIVITGMTSYAMTAHLALNLTWLWLFLQRRRMADLGALAVGFVAVGLHQPLFHPLFVAPILMLLLKERNWQRAAFFAVGYLMVCAFWLLWPKWMLALITGPESVMAAHDVDYLTRLIDTVRAGDSARFSNMAANLLRFVSWQHILLIPLVAASLPAIWRGGLPAALAWGVALPICVMLLILPYQGHGFGYRYLSGVTGNLILLAVYGWMELGDRRPIWRMMMRRATVASAVILLPLQAWMAHSFYAPYARVSQKIEKSNTEYVIIGAQDVSFSNDLVINRADVSNRPVRLIAEELNDDLVRHICRTGAAVALVDDHLLADISAYFGKQEQRRAAERNSILAPDLKSAGCHVSVLQ
jgi:hypothetical protein